jgi:hypothetical protein
LENVLNQHQIAPSIKKMVEAIEENE